MKKKILLTTIVVCMAIIAVSLIGCTDDSEESPSLSEVTFTIQYTDDTGTHTINVGYGMPYALESIPQRTGYDFTGLFDAQVGGTQYVDANGASVAPFNDTKNLVLFPQFKAKQYRIILNYGEAPVTGTREINVEYNSEIQELPTNLSVANMDFKGWFTEQNCGGTQIADTYGLLPDRRLVTEQNFDLSNANGYIYLYAGFTATLRTVTFYTGNGNAPIEMQVAHGTPISEVVPDYRDENGFAVLEWTQDSNVSVDSTVFTGEVTRDMTLYAKTYAPVIEFEENGGEEVIPLVQTAGKNISLPTPVRANYKFLYWADDNGEETNYSTMPSASVELFAVWQAMLVFDENGGIDVSDISQAANTNVTLPTPERDGYVFAGWYTSDGEKYESTRMPANSEVLKAGWYRAETKTTILISSTSEEGGDRKTPSPNLSYLCYEIDPTDYIEDGGSHHIKIVAYVDMRGYSEYSYTGYLNIYNQKLISSSTLINSFKFDNITNKFEQFSFEFDLYDTNSVYLCFYSEEHKSPGAWSFNYLHLSDFYYTIYYPDTSVMY